MKRTSEEEAVLHKHLKGVTGVKHHLAGDTSYDEKVYCSKCGVLCHDRSLEIAEWWRPEMREPCPVPDPYPGSDAEIAEDIRVWLTKNEDGGDWMDAMSEIWQTREWKKGERRGYPIDEWLLYYATPQDKIRAFIEIMKEV